MDVRMGSRYVRFVFEWLNTNLFKILNNNGKYKLNNIN